MISRSKNKSRKAVKLSMKSALLLVIVGVAVGFIVGMNIDKSKASANLLFSQLVSFSDSISASQLTNALSDNKLILINVHTPYEGEIAGTDLFIEDDLILTNKEKLPEDKSTPIILYCKSGRMSAETLATLKSMGYTNVKHLKGGMKEWSRKGYELLDLSKLSEKVLPEEGYELPISWRNIGPLLLEIGVIDNSKFEKIMELSDEQREILTKGGGKLITIGSENSRFVVNMLWALGLAQKSKIYEEGPMGKEYKDKAGNFSSTGGWTLGKLPATSYLGRYNIVDLSGEQQQKIAEIAKNVYRPCCGNSTWFPDCNHGMAALGAIELMVAEGFGEEEIYDNLLALNSFWFPQNYLTVATHFARQGVDWENIDAKLVLGQEYSSAKGASSLAEKVGPLPGGGPAGGSCGA